MTRDEAQACGQCECCEAWRRERDAALSTSAPPAHADLVAIVREWKAAMLASSVPPLSMSENAARTAYRRARADRADAAHRALLAVPLPEGDAMTRDEMGHAGMLLAMALDLEHELGTYPKQAEQLPVLAREMAKLNAVRAACLAGAEALRLRAHAS